MLKAPVFTWKETHCTAFRSQSQELPWKHISFSVIIKLGVLGRDLSIVSKYGHCLESSILVCLAAFSALSSSSSSLSSSSSSVSSFSAFLTSVRYASNFIVLNLYWCESLRCLFKLLRWTSGTSYGQCGQLYFAVVGKWYVFSWSSKLSLVPNCFLQMRHSYE